MQPLSALTQTQPCVELLSPAGDRDCLRAAIENGADAVYFGLETGFNARARAANFHLDDLPEVMAQLHERGVRGYVTLNTLVFPSELPKIERAIVRLVEGNVDAVLVQDLGVARLIRQLCPELSLHASTQMTLTSAECIQAVADLGIERVVLPRELSLDEIRQIHGQTKIELEAFVHGALCVAYSGQCLTSESLGGRSANRGQCAQACRLPYELVCDGRDIDLGSVRYLLSPQDLAAFEWVPDLIDAGVRCLKIEGRLKSAEYVANITGHYRRALDAALADRAVNFSETQIREMELSFSRGFSPGWLHGCDHKMLVPGLSSAKRGILVGTVVGTQRKCVVADLSLPLSAGDGVVFAGDREGEGEQGGRLYKVAPARGKTLLEFRHDQIDFGELTAGQEIWKTDDPKLTARLRKTYSSTKPRRRVPLDLRVDASVGAPLRVVGRAANGATCQVESDGPLAEAIRHPLTAEQVQQQLGRLGGTIFELHDVDLHLEGTPMVPLSVFGRIRKQMVTQLQGTAGHKPPRSAEKGALAQLLASDLSSDPESRRSQPRLHILCRSLKQLEAVLEHDVASVYADFQDIREYGDAVSISRQRDAVLFLATPRIQKPAEAGVFRALARHEPAGFLVRNLAGIAFCRANGIPFVTDYSLNAANPLTVGYLAAKRAQRITTSYDLNRDQLIDLVTAAPRAPLEVVIHQHMPMFHMEHCVFCAVLSPGTNKTNCGRPCDHHRVALRDRVGMEHLLHADVGCRNTLFNATPQSAAEVVPLLIQHGLRDFRVELLDATGDEIKQLLKLYRKLLTNQVPAREVWRQLKASNRVGVTRGTLEERRHPLTIL